MHGVVIIELQLRSSVSVMGPCPPWPYDQAARSCVLCRNPPQWQRVSALHRRIRAATLSGIVRRVAHASAGYQYTTPQPRAVHRSNRAPNFTAPAPAVPASPSRRTCSTASKRPTRPGGRAVSGARKVTRTEQTVLLWPPPYMDYLRDAPSSRFKRATFACSSRR
jgi:hypothetical protein